MSALKNMPMICMTLHFAFMDLFASLILPRRRRKRPRPPKRVMNARRFVCRESSILRGDGGSVMTVSPSRPEARRRFGSQSASELGALVASSIPEQLPGREPASARKGYEDALVLRNRRVEGSSGRDGVARRVLLFGAERPSRLGDIGRAAARLLDRSDRHRG